MYPRRHPLWKPPSLLLGGGLLLAAMVFVMKSRPDSSPPPAKKPSLSDTYPGLDLEDPAASYQALRYVAETGGDPYTRSQAIVWLDDQARSRQPLSSRQAEWLLSILHAGGHPDWDKEYRFWIFNSAFNALHHSPDPEPLTLLLAKLAETHPERTMRLYAMQHLGTQRLDGRLTGALAGKIHALLTRQLVADPDTAGTIIELLVTWDGEEGIKDPATLNQAVEIAADSSRPLDVRVTALHAAGTAALDLSRGIAADAAQPLFVRKAAIALIGRHGGESDLADLQSFASENSRLAQAAGPAREAIRHRLDHPHATAPVPF